ncbi:MULTISPECIES: hypothetical protein [Streptomyces]|uniref:hypothetical protein n=1 Tax=Streptomyces TaxID=1883 RepID=UPI001487F1BA|nr:MULTISPECIES: hypothetical protein [Streptomyces]
MDAEGVWAPEGERLPDEPRAHADEAEFWEDWRDYFWPVVLSPLSTAFGALITYAVVRNAAQVGDWYAALLMGSLLIVGGGILTVGLWMPLHLGWGLGAVVVHCSREGITIKGDIHPWNTVRVLRLGYEDIEVGAANDLEGPGSIKKCHLEVCTETDTLRVTGEVWRSRAHELAEVVERFAPEVRVEWVSGLTFRPKGPSRAARPSRKRVRGEAVALVGVSLVLSVLTCAAVSHWAPEMVTFG